MNLNSLPTERCAIVGVVDPDAYAANSYGTAAVEVSKFRRLMAVVLAGDLGTDATVNAKLQRCSDAAGSNPEDITGATITELTEAGGDSNKQAIINYDTQNEEGNAKRFIRLLITIGTATSDAGGVLFGFDPFYSPASDSDADSVDSIKSV